MEQLEYTGTSYKCNSCNHIWHHEDDACPECGEQENITDIHESMLYKEVNVPTRNGIPTIAWIKTELFNYGLTQVYTCGSYGKRSSTTGRVEESKIIWSENQVNNKIQSFITYLNRIGIETGECVLSSTQNGIMKLGSLVIKSVRN